MTADEIIAALKLQPHPEGGFYRETYRSAHSTAIFFLLPEGAVSRLHRIKSDEVWHFYAGGPLRIVELGAGSTVLSPRQPQHVVAAGRWFGAYPEQGSGYSLVGCTVAPAFRFEDFELGSREDLLREFPDARAQIEKLTP